jgi:hypothetical protein
LSSILDALNKLEKEVASRDYPLAHTGAGRKGITPKSVMGIILIICVCIGAVGLAAYYRVRPEKVPETLTGNVKHGVASRSQKTQEPGAGVRMPKSPVTSVSPAPKATATGTASKPETLYPDNNIETGPKSSEDGKNTANIKTERRQRPTSQEGPKEELVVHTASRKSAPKVLTGAENPSVSQDNLSTKAPVKKEKPLPMNRLEGVGFKIQAISWGDTAPERLVVINNQVLREGDGIEGYRISRINPDDILLRRGSNTYRLDFGLKGKP